MNIQRVSQPNATRQQRNYAGKSFGSLPLKKRFRHKGLLLKKLPLNAPHDSLASLVTLSVRSKAVLPVTKTESKIRSTAPVLSGMDICEEVQQQCQGRSSRHPRTLCRRQAHKGSRYCKLHMRQYEASGDDVDGGHQDRRYQEGHPYECRCLATTTRGRPCAYVAINGTKYCNLHADYDTNPPPRRGARKESTSTKRKEKHADSPYPLLSMISTDQWSDQGVRIATGPFAGRTGTVQKWGNGWVSVDIPGIGMHNRRSFELYLLQDQKPLVVNVVRSPSPDTTNSTLSDESELRYAPVTPRPEGTVVNTITPSLSSTSSSSKWLPRLSKETPEIPILSRNE